VDAGERGWRLNARCTRFDRIRDVTPHTPEGGEQCLAMGDT
jgi:hypothetical protein